MKKQYILGISAYYHDSSACLIHGGEIIAAISEERFSRLKHDLKFPSQSIKYCLKEANIKLTDVDSITYYEKPLTTFERLLETYFRNSPFGFNLFRASFPIWVTNKIFIKSKIINELMSLFSVNKVDIPKLLFCPHHLSHAASAFYPSPFQSAAILCIDGVGEYATTTIWHGRNNKLLLKKQINFPHSIGLLYSSFTYYCGFKVNDGEYKLMGLAPYGKPKYVALINEQLITFNDDKSFFLNMKFFNYEKGLTMTNDHFHNLFNGPPRKEDSIISQKYMDIACSIQIVIEALILNLAKYALEITQEKSLCMAGGVALNCVANGKILKDKILEGFWIQPAANDSGGSLGAALATFYLHKKNIRVYSDKDMMKSCFLGPSYSQEESINILENFNAVYSILKDDEDLAEKASSLINQNKIIGWFQGRSEFGPRALGNRSIIGNAYDPKLQKALNLKIKFRESFRPFAPAVLEEDMPRVFESIVKSPYMLLVDTIKAVHLKGSKNEKHQGLKRLEHITSKFPAVTHVNDTARIQSISSENNPLLYKLLIKIKQEKLFGIIVNTSFNVRNEPIVNSPLDAYKCFMNTEMDYLFVGKIFLEKSKQPKLKQCDSCFTVSILSKKELIIFWLKFYLIILIIFNITLPFFGLDRLYSSFLFGLAPLLLVFLSQKISQDFTIQTKLYLNYLQKSQNFILLAFFYFCILFPYSIFVKLFISQQDSESSWREDHTLEINDKMF